MYGAKFSHQLTKNHARAIFLAGLVISAAIGSAEYRRSAWITRIDHALLDTFLRISAPDRPALKTVAVDIDELSLAAIGQWPWPRYRMAALVQAIAAHRPASIGLDVLFSEPDRTSLVSIQQTFKRDFNVDITFAGAPAGLSDNDGYFGHVLSQAGAVGSKYFYFDHSTKPEASSEPELRFTGRTDLLSLSEASGVLMNTHEISSRTKTSGFINTQADEDGTLRRLPLLISHNGVIHAHLALATVMKSLGTTVGTVEADMSGPVVRIGNHRIPIDEKGFALLRFNGKPGLYPAVSAMDVLNGSVRPADIEGKIVYVGSSAAGLNDLHNTAFDAQFPGLKLQAVMAENIANDYFVRNPAWAGTAIVVACLVTGALMSALFVAASGAFLALLGSLVLGGVLLLAAVIPLANAGLFVSPGAPLVLAAALLVLFSVARFAIEKRHAYLWFKRLENARQVTMESMAAVAETRDPETGAHIKRTQHYVKAIAEELRRSGHYTDILTQEYIDLLFVSAPLHDIGKVGVPDHILLKRGKLTEEEFVIMKRHAEFGRSIIMSTAQFVDGDNFLLIAGEIAASHHEKWDGTGYPLGLAGQDIPLSGRLMSIADIYDALISRRCYKEPYPHLTATTLLREGRGKSFDPAVLDAFFRIEDTVKEIAARFADDHAPANASRGGAPATAPPPTTRPSIVQA